MLRMKIIFGSAKMTVMPVGQRKWLNVIFKFCNVIDTGNRLTAGCKKKAFMLVRETAWLSFWFSEAP